MSSTTNSPPTPEQPDPNRFRLTPEEIKLVQEGTRRDLQFLALQPKRLPQTPEEEALARLA